MAYLVLRVLRCHAAYLRYQNRDSNYFFPVGRSPLTPNMAFQPSWIPQISVQIIASVSQYFDK